MRKFLLKIRNIFGEDYISITLGKLMNKTISQKNYFNIFKHKFLSKYNKVSQEEYFFTFFNKKIVFDNKHLANKNLIQWCLNKNYFKKKSSVSTEIFYEKKEMRAFEKLISDSNYFIDAGAQTGIYSLAAYQAKNIKKIVSIDITKEYIDAIRKNIKINNFKSDKFEILNTGIGSGKILHKEWISKTLTTGCSFEDIINITGIRLSENDCIKVDIEGWELFIAGKLGDFFKINKPNLLLSFHKAEIEGLSNNKISENDIFDFLSENYRYKYMTDDKMILKKINNLKEHNLENEKYKTIFFSNKHF